MRVRILTGRHAQDVIARMADELGDDRAANIGPVSLSRNPLRTNVQRINRAHLTPPLVEGLGEQLARLIGDQSASTTIRRYALAGGRPMPTRLVEVARRVNMFRLGAGYAGTLIGWSDRTRRPYLQVITPDDLEVDYLSDDPLTPTIIRHRRTRIIDGEPADVLDVYDLSDLDNPSFRVIRLSDDADVTEDALGRRYDGDDYWWRYSPTEEFPLGRPFHRIVISGDPRDVYSDMELVEGTLEAAVLQTHWKAGVRDAGFPRVHVIGLHMVGVGSDAVTGASGMTADPTVAVVWAHDDPDRPGSITQLPPGFDPEAIGRSLRQNEQMMMAAFGLPVSMESTGGEPTAREAEALREVIASTYPDCRAHDSLVLRRVAAIVNQASKKTPGMTPLDLPERAWPVLYREEVEQALAEVEPQQADSET
ncbi:MAG: hypothetical protein D6798_00160 [Deltaproteobacteria bacterium]|nr:MAG: hypothetical protein D6798_00160 [Deltaproteobacteria bacterium]